MPAEIKGVSTSDAKQEEIPVPVLTITMDQDGDVVFHGDNCNFPDALCLLRLCESKIIAEYMRGVYTIKLDQQKRQEALTAPVYVPQGIVRK